MATLTRQQDPFRDDTRDAHHELSLNIPKPFPSHAEREQDELLESLEEEELHLGTVEPSITTPSLQSESLDLLDLRPPPVQEVTRTRSEDLLPSIGHVQTSCLTTLNDLLSTKSAHWAPIVPDRRHSLPPSSLAATTSLASSSLAQHQSALQKLVSNLRIQQASPAAREPSTLTEVDLLKELQERVQHVGSQLPPHEAELARTLVSLLIHLQHASSSHPITTTFTSGRVASWSDLSNTPTTSSPSSTDPFATLKRQVSDFKLERSWMQPRSSSAEASTSTSPRDTASTALWAKIDEELEAVLSLCHWQPDSELLPPEYDAGDYEGHHYVDNLPKYEPASDARDLAQLHGSYKDGASLYETTTRASEHSLRRSSVSEKMKMDLEAVTLAIDRLYLVAPQLHNQRVELKKSKLEELERAKRHGKGKLRETGADADARELSKLVDLVSKAADRKMVDQSVILDGSLQDKLNKARREDDKKRTAFVEQLAKHSDAGRLHSQDAVFLSPSRTQFSTQASSKTRDPCALLSLPEFIREGVPEDILREMEIRRDAETLLTLPEFIKRYPRPELAHTASSAELRGQSRRVDVESTSPPPVERPTKNRSRSMSEPLAWLLSGSRSSSPQGGLTHRKYKSGKFSRPKSSNGAVPTVHEGLDVSYVAEYHESLQHVLGFFTISEPPLGVEVEAEVELTRVESPHEREFLTIRCGPNTSPPLELPTSVAEGKVDIDSIGGKYYQVKLRSNPFSSLSSSAQFDLHTEFLDATRFQGMAPTSFICSSCSLPLAHVAQLFYRDLPSEHWAELVDAWMCHSDLKLHEHVKKGSKDGFWPGQGQVLVGGSYVLLREDAVVKGNLREAEVPAKSPFEDSTRIRCICGALLGRRQQHPTEEGCTVYRFVKYAFRPMSPSADPIRVPLSAFIVEDMNEYVYAHATYRFIIADEEEERPRILIWLFKPNMRLAYSTPAQYVIPKSGSIRAAKVLFKILGPTTATELPGILKKYPGFPQAEHLYYPRDICRRLSAVLKESNTAYPESMRTMTGLDVGWLQRA